MKRLYFPSLFCAAFAALCLVGSSMSGPFAARRAARQQANASSGCSGASASSCAGASGAGVTYTYYMPAPASAPASVPVAPAPPPKPASTPAVPNMLEVADRAGEAGAANPCPAGCACCSAVKTQVAVKPRTTPNGTVVHYNGRLWAWDTASDEWKLIDVATPQAAMPTAAPVYYSQPASFASAACSS